MTLCKLLKTQEKHAVPAAAVAEDGPPGAGMIAPSFAEAPAGGNEDKCVLMRTFAYISMGIFHNAGKPTKAAISLQKPPFRRGFSITPPFAKASGGEAGRAEEGG